ncbi:hypothetical protein GLP59_15335 [Sulfitobacter sp. M220]|uniref:hypothetical protein n=1 Tax=Sulfitobacter sp. M220 TaxID=2675333 RepID=UPI001F47F0B4|nr:hypothetical protein [Sulfitobacter sp. M220]MCF7779001.1 hypothetical protein [Sulfitobacter sp. M220]
MDGNISSLSYSPSPFQKPSTTDLVLNKVCGGEKMGQGAYSPETRVIEHRGMAAVQTELSLIEAKL